MTRLLLGLILGAVLGAVAVGGVWWYSERGTAAAAAAEERLLAEAYASIHVERCGAQKATCQIAELERVAENVWRVRFETGECGLYQLDRFTVRADGSYSGAAAC